MAMIFVVSSMPSPPQPPELVSDKGVHFLLYSGLSSLVVRALAGGWLRRLTLRAGWLAVLISTAYGATDELHQHFVPPRQMEALDLVADAVGAVLAALVLYAAGLARNAARNEPE
jgi:VanZ family protein